MVVIFLFCVLHDIMSQCMAFTDFLSERATRCLHHNIIEYHPGQT